MTVTERFYAFHPLLLCSISASPFQHLWLLAKPAIVLLKRSWKTPCSGALEVDFFGLLSARLKLECFPPTSRCLAWLLQHVRSHAHFSGRAAEALGPERLTVRQWASEPFCQSNTYMMARSYQSSIGHHRQTFGHHRYDRPWVWHFFWEDLMCDLCNYFFCGSLRESWTVGKRLKERAIAGRGFLGLEEVWVISVDVLGRPRRFLRVGLDCSFLVYCLLRVVFFPFFVEDKTR